MIGTSRSRVLGPSMLAFFAGIIFMLFWIARVVTDPDAYIEIFAVLPLSAMVVWRFLRVGIWIKDDQLTMRNIWGTHRHPLDEVRLLVGHVDDISDFDRFTGGETNRYRASIGDSFAERKFLRHRLAIDGEQLEIDAMVGRTPSGQLKAATKIRRALGLDDGATETGLQAATGS